MKYQLELDVQGRDPVVPLNLKLKEKNVREFKYVTKQIRVSMTEVLNKFLEEFVSEHRAQGAARQKEMF
jgi:hypothetical protein